MSLSRLYLLLCVIGFVVPHFEFVSWLIENGIDVGGFFSAMTASAIARFFVWDVVISAIAVIAVTLADREKLPAVWPPIAGTLLVGVSLGLPLYLYLRQKKAEAAWIDSASLRPS